MAQLSSTDVSRSHFGTMLLVIRRDSPSVAGTEAQAQAAIIYGRTLRAWLLQVPVLYPFGHGLVYTSFTYSPPQIRQSCSASQPCLEVTLRVHNTGMIQPCVMQMRSTSCCEMPCCALITATKA